MYRPFIYIFMMLNIKYSEHRQDKGAITRNHFSASRGRGVLAKNLLIHMGAITTVCVEEIER